MATTSLHSPALRAAGWVAGQGGGQTKHLIFETEFGNYNGTTAWGSAAKNLLR